MITNIMPPPYSQYQRPQPSSGPQRDMVNHVSYQIPQIYFKRDVGDNFSLCTTPPKREPLTTELWPEPWPSSLTSNARQLAVGGPES